MRENLEKRTVIKMYLGLKIPGCIEQNVLAIICFQLCPNFVRNTLDLNTVESTFKVELH